MRIAGIILIVAGILMFIFNGINFTTEKKVVDLGPVEINKKEKKSVGLPETRKEINNRKVLINSCGAGRGNFFGIS